MTIEIDGYSFDEKARVYTRREGHGAIHWDEETLSWHWAIEVGPGLSMTSARFVSVLDAHTSIEKSLNQLGFIQANVTAAHAPIDAGLEYRRGYSVGAEDMRHAILQLVDWHGDLADRIRGLVLPID